ncbi:MAG: hypothetical protein HOH58_08915 [Opitutaceae bacterium]|jgi:hypothetical protein|nr:hypothetical protein [Opitutaceae bacterium]
MASDDFDPTQRRLCQWRVDPPCDPNLTDKVLQRIRVETRPAPRQSPLLIWLKETWQRPVYVGALALVLILTGVLISTITHQFRGSPDNVVPTEDYRFAIDPLYRLTESGESFITGAQPAPDTVGDSLEWLRTELGLTDHQFQKLASLHEEFTPTFASIFHDLQQQKSAVEQFETMRRESELIDFIQVYRVTTDYRHLQDRASTSTAELVARVTQLVDAKQRSHYLELLKIAPEQSKNVDAVVPRHA